MAEEVRDGYKSSLAELAFNSKPHINMLTMLADDSKEYAADVVQVIEQHLRKSKVNILLPIMYLIDSIVKNVKDSEYAHLFSQTIVSTFCYVFEKVDEKTRASLFKLRQTWSSVFPNSKLYALDLKVQGLDPAWPITATPEMTPSSIHVNPKFLLKSSQEEIAAAAVEEADAEAERLRTQEIKRLEEVRIVEERVRARRAEETRARIEQDRQAQLMQQQVMAKQQELMRLKQQQLELELAEARRKIDLQAQEFQRKEQMLKQKAEESSRAEGTDGTTARDPRITSRDPRSRGKSSDNLPVAAVAPTQSALESSIEATLALQDQERRRKEKESEEKRKLEQKAKKEKEDKELKEKTEKEKKEKERKEKEKREKEEKAKKEKEKRDKEKRDKEKRDQERKEREKREKDRQEKAAKAAKAAKDKEEKDTVSKPKTAKEESSTSPRQTRGSRENSRKSHHGSTIDASPTRRRSQRLRGGDNKEGGRRTHKSRSRSRSPNRDRPTRSGSPKASHARHHAKDRPSKEREPDKETRSSSTRKGRRPADKESRSAETEHDTKEAAANSSRDEGKEPPPKKIKVEDKLDKKQLPDDMALLFGTEDQDYRKLPPIPKREGPAESGDTPRRSVLSIGMALQSPSQGWAQFKASHPTDFPYTKPKLELQIPPRDPLLSSPDALLSPPTPSRPQFSPLSTEASNLSIPKPLMLNSAEWIMAEAEQQVRSGKLSHEQHQQLLQQLAQLYKLQKLKQQLRSPTSTPSAGGDTDSSKPPLPDPRRLSRGSSSSGPLPRLALPLAPTDPRNQGPRPPLGGPRPMGPLHADGPPPHLSGPEPAKTPPQDPRRPPERDPRGPPIGDRDPQGPSSDDKPGPVGHPNRDPRRPLQNQDPRGSPPVHDQRGPPPPNHDPRVPPAGRDPRGPPPKHDPKGPPPDRDPRRPPNRDPRSIQTNLDRRGPSNQEPGGIVPPGPRGPPHNQDPRRPSHHQGSPTEWDSQGPPPDQSDMSDYNDEYDGPQFDRNRQSPDCRPPGRGPPERGPEKYPHPRFQNRGPPHSEGRGVRPALLPNPGDPSHGPPRPPGRRTLLPNPGLPMDHSEGPPARPALLPDPGQGGDMGENTRGRPHPRPALLPNPGEENRGPVNDRWDPRGPPSRQRGQYYPDERGGPDDHWDSSGPPSDRRGPPPRRPALLPDPGEPQGPPNDHHGRPGPRPGPEGAGYGPPGLRDQRGPPGGPRDARRLQPEPRRMPPHVMNMDTDEPLSSSADQTARSEEGRQPKDSSHSPPSLPRRGLLPSPGNETQAIAKNPMGMEEPGQKRRWIMKPGEVTLPYDPNDYYVPQHDPRWFNYTKSGPQVLHELIIDKRGYELPLGGPPRRFNLDGKQVKVQADAVTRQVLINDKPLYKIGAPVVEINVTGTPHMMYYHGPMKKIWIDGYLFEVQADAPPLRVIIANEKHWLRLDDSSGDVFIGEVAVCKYACPARTIKIKGNDHDIQFVPPPRQILIDGKLCGLDFRGAYPFIVISNKAHGIRFDGPPREILIDGKSFTVPMNCSRKASFGNNRPHILAFGGPGHEIIIDGKWYEVKFAGAAKDVQVGLHMVSIQLVGPPPEVKILGEMVNSPGKVEELAQGMEVNPMYAVLPNIQGLYEDKVVRYPPPDEKPSEDSGGVFKKEVIANKDAEPAMKEGRPGDKDLASEVHIKPSANQPGLDPRGPSSPQRPHGLRGASGPRRPNDPGHPDFRGSPDLEPNRGPQGMPPHMRPQHLQSSDIPFMGSQPRPRLHGHHPRGPFDRQPGYDRQPGPFNRFRGPNERPRGPFPRQRGPYDRQPNFLGPGQPMRGPVPADMRVPPDMFPAPLRGPSPNMRHPGPDGPRGPQPNTEPNKGPDGAPNILNMLGNVTNEMLQNLTAIARGLPPGLSGMLSGSQPGAKPDAPAQPQQMKPDVGQRQPMPRNAGPGPAPPPQQAAADAQDKEMQQMDVDDLLSRLIRTGIIRSEATPTGSPSAKPVPAEGEAPVAVLDPASLLPPGTLVIRPQVKKDEPIFDDIPDISDFNMDSLKQKYDGVIQRIYSGIQCSSCGLRFAPDQVDRYREHLDWHFRQNRREKDGVKVAKYRRWYYSLADWIRFEEFSSLEEQAQSAFFEKQQEAVAQAPSAAPKVPAGELSSCPVAAENSNDDVCDICGDPFEQFWDEDAEEWHLKDAVRINNITYHPICYQDAAETSMLESSILETPSPNFEPSDPMADLSGADSSEAPEAMDTDVSVKEEKVDEVVAVKQEVVVVQPTPASPVEEMDKEELAIIKTVPVVLGEMDAEELAIIKEVPVAKTTPVEVTAGTPANVDSAQADTLEKVKPSVREELPAPVTPVLGESKASLSPAPLSQSIPVTGSPSHKPDLVATASPIAVVVGSPRKPFSPLAGPPSQSSTPPPGTATPPPGSASPYAGRSTPPADSATPPPSETSSVCSQDDSAMAPLLSPATPADGNTPSPERPTQPYLMKGVQSIRVLSQVKRDFC